MREFVKSFFSFGLATSIEKLMTFLLLPIFTRIFSTTEYGVIDLIQVILGIVSIFAVLQLETALQRYYYEYEGRNKKLFISTIFYSIIVLSIFITGILCIFANEVSILIFKNVYYSGLIRLASLQLPLSNFSMLAFVLLRYEKKNVKFLVMILIRVVITLIFIFLFVIFMKKGVYGIFYAQLLSMLVSSILLYFSIKEIFVIDFSTTFLKKSYQYALPLFPARIGSVLMSYANRFFMIGYLTIAAVGIFSLSLKFASVVQLIYFAFLLAWAPFMFQQMKLPNHKETFSKVFLFVACPVFFIVSAISLFSKEIVSIVVSNEFFESYRYVGGLSLYYSLFIFKEIVDIGPKFTEKTRYISYTFLLSLIVNITCLYFFIRLFGLSGIVYSMIISNTFLLIMSWVVSNRLYFIPYNVLKFTILASPAYLIPFALFYISPTLLTRIFIFIFVLFFYGLVFVKFFKVLKQPKQITIFEKVPVKI